MTSKERTIRLGLLPLMALAVTACIPTAEVYYRPGGWGEDAPKADRTPLNCLRISVDPLAASGVMGAPNAVIFYYGEFFVGAGLDDELKYPGPGKVDEAIVTLIVGLPMGDALRFVEQEFLLTDEATGRTYTVELRETYSTPYRYDSDNKLRVTPYFPTIRTGVPLHDELTLEMPDFIVKNLRYKFPVVTFRKTVWASAVPAVPNC